MLLSILLIYAELTGGDPKHIVLIHFNVILKYLYRLDWFRSLMATGYAVKSNTLIGETSIYLYIAHFLTFILYGLCFDGLKNLFVKLSR
jgi:hypothetical protein